MNHKKRLLIAGTKSGCGKTTITCGLLQCLINRKLTISSFKCGPDYIDPLFHETVIGTKSSNLDPYFMSNNALKEHFCEIASDSDYSIIEGVMGYYDGIGFSSKASTFTVSSITKTPTILVIDCKGMGYSVCAHLKGFLEYTDNNMIKGVIFNRMPTVLYEKAAKEAKKLGVEPFGYLPSSNIFTLKSRHLGLVTAAEINDIKEKLYQLSLKMEKTINIDKILSFASQANNLERTPSIFETKQHESIHVKIGVAKDNAFCFLYKDNIRLLEKAGAQIEYFSPLSDSKLPDGINGLLLSGGYPELYAKQLSENKNLLIDIRKKIKGGLPTIAECGGFMFLHEILEDEQGKEYNMTGVIKGKCFPTHKLQHFGYIELTLKENLVIGQKNDTMKAHEFHYWESDFSRNSCHAVKASKSKEWNCVWGNTTLYAGYPHLYFYSNPNVCINFLKQCKHYEQKREGLHNNV